ncbi:putative membrane protein [Paenibacillus algicola]|uniref:Putative membrane protein n=1 Tax=Paenibacillus algicola TaxID=2565926 RepID=A0A4V1G4A1_9BACL|nr:ABC transporter permease [Paenibacillus algicola]QCT03974.1 putative membrane protein [Paenibacillus algicola]
MNWSRKLINPVLDKEFRLRMRSPKSMLSVLLYVMALGGVAMAFIYIFLYLEQGGQQRFDPSMSRSMFYVLSFAQLVLIAFMAPALTAGVISSEREKQTLSMLLTTQQSSATIVLSKLLSSLSFMALIVLSTLPVYSIVFLYGGISPQQLISVFLFYLFVMLLLGSLGVMFSTLFKRTIVAIIVTYGAGLFIFLGTGLLFLFFMSLDSRDLMINGAPPVNSISWTGYILGLNPAGALISLFEPSFSKEVFYMMRGGSSLNSKAPIQLWQEFVIVYSVVIVLVLMVAIRKIRPVKRGSWMRRKSTKPQQPPESVSREG